MHKLMNKMYCFSHMHCVSNALELVVETVAGNSVELATLFAVTISTIGYFLFKISLNHLHG